MACANQVGVKNIMIKFTDCETGQTFGPIKHELATEEIPKLRLCPYKNEMLPGGYVKRRVGQNEIEMNVIRDTRIPLSFYQGCAETDIQIEYFNGLVYSGVGGTNTGEERSDTHEVAMTMVFRTIDELLPSGRLQAA